MNELFLNIESSCDSIINKRKVNEDEDINEASCEEVINLTELNDNPDNINNIELKIQETQLEEIKIEEKDEPNIIETI